MCGICGIVRFSGPSDGSAHDRVLGMIAALEHRGPDDRGVAAVPAAVFGATRLAIRGIRDGHQPIVDEENGTVVVCNGEIDNHRELRTLLQRRGRAVPRDTDIAVIPGLYREFGDEFVTHLVGAFALALFDVGRGRLILARDRAGERPLYYSDSAGEISFASELSALLTDHHVAASLDTESLASFIQYGVIPAPGSPFHEVRKVGAGERLVFESSGRSSARYWRWPVGVRSEPPSADRFDTVFRDAVRRQTDVEVPFAVMLSGGIDSSLVAAVARSLRPDAKLRAFTVRFRDGSFDEGEPARRVAHLLDIDLAEVWAGPEDVPRELTRLIATTGEPLADPAWIPTSLLARRVSADARVALVGEGADELFGGYPTYVGARKSERYAALPASLRSLLDGVISRLPTSDQSVPLSSLLAKFVSGYRLDGRARHLLWTSNTPASTLARLGIEAPARQIEPLPNLLDTLQRHDVETSLAEGLLTKSDRAGMLSAVECRAPFLDQGVLEFAASLPEEDRVRGWTTKVFLKRYAARYLPAWVLKRRKHGLSVPLGRWFRKELRDWAAASLTGVGLRRLGIRSEDALDLLDEHCARKVDHARAIWSLIVLNEWLAWFEKTIERPRRQPLTAAAAAPSS